MDFRKAILNFFTLLNTVYLGLMIYIEFFMENLNEGSIRNLLRFMDVCFCWLLCNFNFQFCNVWKGDLMELKIKKISHNSFRVNENNNDSQQQGKFKILI